MVGLVSSKIFCLTSPASSRQLGYWVRCRTRWVGDVCHGFVCVVLSSFSIMIVLSYIACVFIDWRFASVRMASTGVARS